MFKNFNSGACFYVLFIMTGNSLVAGFVLNLVRPEVTYWLATFYSAIVLFGLMFLLNLMEKFGEFFSKNKIRIRIEKKQP
jgi:hypothetical protein